MEKFKLWKDNTENKGLHVHMGKAKVMNCVKGSVRRKGVGRNSIFCVSCDAWVHKKCSGIKGRLVDIPDFKCHRCQHTLLMVDLLNMFYSEIKNWK